MAEFYVVTLGPAAVILALILLIRMRRALRDIREQARMNPPDWPADEDLGDPDETLWRRAYRG